MFMICVSIKKKFLLKVGLISFFILIIFPGVKDEKSMLSKYSIATIISDGKLITRNGDVFEFLQG